MRPQKQDIRATRPSPTPAKIAHLTSVHPSLDVRIFHKECKTLNKAGYEVVLVAPQDSSEKVEGITIRGVTVAQNRRERMTRTVQAVLRAAVAEDADLYHFHDPELIPVGLWLKARGKRVVYDVHEHVPQQILAKPWIPAWLKRPLSAGTAVVEGVGAQLFDGISAATPEIASRFAKNKTVTVQNFPIMEEFDRTGATPYRERPSVIAYVGNIAAARGAWEMVRAMECLPEESGTKLVFAGAFQPVELQRKLEAAPGWSRVEVAGWLSRAQVAELLGRTRVGMVTLHPLVNYLDAYPIKLFEYMAAGIPVVASDFPLWRRIVEEAGCGLLVDPLDPAAIADAIQWLLENTDEAEAMGERGRQAVTDKYNWDVEAEKLLTLYRTLLQ